MGSRGSLAWTLLLLLLITSMGQVLSQTTLTGLSIDCGSVVNYTDSQIQWVTDAGYVRTGKNAQVTAQNSILNPNQSKSLRYFDEGRGRDCYEVPVTPQYTHLIRATFHYGDWNSPENITDFFVYLNGNQWTRIGPFIRGDPAGSNVEWDNKLFEVLVYIENDINILDFCLVRRSGTPFISSLELRKLESGMYSTVVGDHKYMATATRLNTGADASGPLYLRFPDDQYDRIWITPPPSMDNSTHIRTKNITTATTLERPPKKVMEDASIYYNSDVLWFLAVEKRTIPIGPIAVYSYFLEVDGNASASNVRGMEYYVNDYKIDTFNSSDQPYEVRSCTLDVYETFINITVKKASWSKLSPMVNAIEIYSVFNWDGSSTASEEVTAIRSLQNLLGLTDWTGDPCVPIPYDWLDCNSDQSPTVDLRTSLGLSSDKTLHVINVSLPNRATIHTLPQEITSLPNLNTLDLSNTGMASIPSLGMTGLRNLTLLNVSNNHFSGGVREFVQNVTVRSLKQLFAANNLLEGEFPLDQLYSGFPNLQEANFDENPSITGILNLTIWHTALMRSINSTSNSVNAAVTAPVVSLRNNNITGITPSLDSLQADINSYLHYFNTTPGSTNFGILLGGNPWCEKQSFSAQSLPQQYLCRSFTDQVLPGLGSLYESKKSDPWPILGGVIGGVAAVASCICVAAVWRLRKQTTSLKDVQEALARQKVKPPFYSYTELRAATNDFSSANKLGQGTFGAVYKGTLPDRTDGTEEVVAVKKLYPSKQALTEFLNEAVLITGIKHRNLVQLKGCCVHKEDQRMLVYEYAEKGNLAEALWGPMNETSSKDQAEPIISPTIDWQQRLNISVGIARGLSYLHEELQPRIIHRDIKPYNILMDKNYDPKIADFGLARSLLEGQAQADFTSVAGTKGYFSPEYATQGQLTEKADVFSFGVVLLEIVSGRKCIDPHLAKEKQFLQAYARQLKESGNLIDLLDPSVRSSAIDEEVTRVINLAFLCLDFDPEKRPKMSEAVTMLQGIMEVPLYNPESAPSIYDDVPYRRSKSRHKYIRLTKFLDVNEDHALDSFLISATSSNGDNLELGKLSGR